MRRNPPRFLDPPTPLPPNLSFVLALSPSAMTLGLGNMRALLDAVGHPEASFDSVVVAGTNGKGSVTAYLSAILADNGRHVGWYSSPHVYSVNERISVDNEPVDLELMEHAAATIVPLHEAIGYSYFEALTAIAYLVFAELGVEVAVLETGLGGRFDATNAVEPVLSILTSISLDHRRILGDSEEEILREKLGITRPGVPFITGELSEPLREIVEEKMTREGVPLVPFEAAGSIELESMSFDGLRARVRTPSRDYGVLTLPFLGRHQLNNALLSIAAAERLLDKVENLDGAAAHTYMPGRFQRIDVDSKIIVLDVAHNDAGLSAATRTLAELSPAARNGLVFGLLKRKDLVRWPQEVADAAHRVWLIEAVPEESLASPWLLERIGLDHLRGRGVDVLLQPRFTRGEAWDRFMEGLLRDATVDVVLVTGSHRTVEVFGRQIARRIGV